MRKILTFLLAVVCAIAVSAQEKAPQAHHRVGLPIDWSSRHVVHPGKLDIDLARAGTHDPRIIYDWILHNTKRPVSQSLSAKKQAVVTPKKAGLRVDWHFPLGSGTLGQSTYPAKFTYDVNATPSCANDYLVYGSNVAGSSSQPNLVRFNNIYAGTTGSSFPITSASESGTTVTVQTPPNTFATNNYVTITGVTPAGYDGTYKITVIDSAHFTYTDVAGLTTPATTTGATVIQSGQCGTTPTVEAAYNINTASGFIGTSPAVSLDGTKLAFIETGSSSSVFHVLAWATSGSSGSFNTSTNLYSSVTPGGVNDNATLTSLTYSSTTNTWSSPWVDYDSDTAFFGDDSGKLYRTTCVFSCASGVSPAIMSGWPVTVSAGTQLSPPVYDSVSGKVFVGSSDGKLYAVTVSTATLAGSIVVGAGSGATCTASGATPPQTACGGVYDGPILDTTFDLLYAFSGNNGGGAGVMVQTNAGFNLNCGGIGGSSCIANSKEVVTMGGPTAGFNIYIGALTNAYYQNTIGGTLNSSSEIYTCGQQGNSAQPDLYFTSFSTVTSGALSLTNPPIMNGASSQVGKVNVAGNSGIGCTPLSEFNNPNATSCGSGVVSSGCDQLFFSQSATPSTKCVTGGFANEGCTYMYPINSPPGTNTNNIALFAQEFNGTSAQVVDNVSTQPQNSSIYFANERATPLGGTTETALCTLGTGASAVDAYCAIKLTQSALQ